MFCSNFRESDSWFGWRWSWFSRYNWQGENGCREKTANWRGQWIIGVSSASCYIAREIHWSSVCLSAVFWTCEFIFIFLHPQKISAEIAKPKSVKTVSSRPSQKSILAGIVRKRKASPGLDEPAEKQSPNKSSIANDSTEKQAPLANKVEKIDSSGQPSEKEKSSPSKNAEAKGPIVVSDLSHYDEGALKCIGILPGIGRYRESSDSEKSTDTDEEYDFGEFDWMGRKMKKDGDDGECH